MLLKRVWARPGHLDCVAHGHAALLPCMLHDLHGQFWQEFPFGPVSETRARGIVAGRVKLTDRFRGRQCRLTDVQGKVVRGILS